MNNNFCSKCGNKLNIGDRFCQSCGSAVVQSVSNINSQVENQPNNEMNQTNPIHQEFENQNSNVYPNQPINNGMNYQSNQNNNNNNSDFKKYMPFIIVGAIVLLIIIFVINGLGGNSNNNNYNNDNGNNSNSNTNNNNENNSNKIKGTFSREIFSNRSYNYKTSYDNAVFKFNSDSTFEVTYTGGDTYKGIYEVYNGLNISTKANEIKRDSSISNAEQLSIDINNVANAMMSDAEYMLNTYLLWLKTDDGILQPFVIKYDTNANTGTAVNILGQTQGSFTLR